MSDISSFYTSGRVPDYLLSDDLVEGLKMVAMALEESLKKSSYIFLSNYSAAFWKYLRKYSEFKVCSNEIEEDLLKQIVQKFIVSSLGDNIM